MKKKVGLKTPEQSTDITGFKAYRPNYFKNSNQVSFKNNFIAPNSYDRGQKTLQPIPIDTYNDSDGTNLRYLVNNKKNNEES